MPSPSIGVFSVIGVVRERVNVVGFTVAIGVGVVRVCTHVVFLCVGESIAIGSAFGSPPFVGFRPLVTFTHLGGRRHRRLHCSCSCLDFAPELVSPSPSQSAPPSDGSRGRSVTARRRYCREERNNAIKMLIIFLFIFSLCFWLFLHREPAVLFPYVRPNVRGRRLRIQRRNAE